MCVRMDRSFQSVHVCQLRRVERLVGRCICSHGGRLGLVACSVTLALYMLGRSTCRVYMLVGAWELLYLKQETPSQVPVEALQDVYT
jgi:hypothetical protein